MPCGRPAAASGAGPQGDSLFSPYLLVAFTEGAGGIQGAARLLHVDVRVYDGQDRLEVFGESAATDAPLQLVTLACCYLTEATYPHMRDGMFKWLLASW